MPLNCVLRRFAFLRANTVRPYGAMTIRGRFVKRPYNQIQTTKKSPPKQFRGAFAFYVTFNGTELRLVAFFAKQGVNFIRGI